MTTRRFAIDLSLAILLVVGSSFQTARAEVKVPALIGDNMVLQQGRRARIWGTADPGERVTIRLADHIAHATADGQGKWQAFVGPLKAGGPFELTIAGKNTLVFKNVLVGEVWVCSGQSNMEFALVNSKDGASAIAEADYPQVRLFTVRHATSATPLDDVHGQWLVTTPKTAGQFSAVGFYFGRELHRRLKVPIGLIHSSWGGTPAEAWTSYETLTSVPSLKPILDRYDAELQALPERQRKHQQAIADWEHQYALQDPGNKGEAMGYADPSLVLEGWKPMDLPRYWESTGLNVDGSIWFRKDVEVPKAWAGHDLTLSLGPVDDYDTTYFNGQRVGAIGSENAEAYSVPRSYKIPGRLVRPGKALIAVRVFDRMGNGGFAGSPDQMFLAPEGGGKKDGLALDGKWDFKAEMVVEGRVPDYSKYPGPPPGPDNPNSPSVLYNAMLAPIVPYAIRGAIWYQGESNAGRAYQYRTLFPLMIGNWRTAWGEGNFPFYFVQLANFMARKPQPGESEWAELREAQTLTLHSADTGMAVAIDIGEGEDIHPRDKLDVGLRLSRWALVGPYAQKLEPSGPLYDSFAIEGDKVRLRFKHIGAGLKTPDGAPLKGFAIAAADHKFVWADARIEGDSIIVWSKDVAQPVAVRYAWADNPACNLYNEEGLPASPFRTDSWPGVTAGRN
jgi:sialate O-acetylesterase